MRKLASGRWQALYTHPVTRRRETGPTLFDTKADAGRWLASVQTDLARGALPDPSGERARFAEYAEAWLAAKVDVRPATHELYSYLLRSHVLPTFGPLPVGRIDPATVRRWYSALAASDLSKATTAKAYRLLRQILAAAVDDRLLRENPCRVAGAASERSAERQIPTLDSVMSLAAAMDARYRAMVYLAAFVGLRRGECLGLVRGDVSLESSPPTVRVRQQVVHLAAGAALSEPKTAAGRRRVALPAVVADEVRRHLDQFVNESPDALLFPAPTGGLVTKMSWRRIWDRAVAASGYEATFHDLRHVAGTLNAEAGASIKEAMARLGHASSHAALRYQHAVEQRDAAVAEGINDLLNARVSS